ncbi:hypothetical protein MNBD_GAMMA01-1130 [hydrothermal vent metagenome]|uniref:Uncharacterized protein n=1 Tax=hydrothermal vent metagenome TaxID=652676 RepID=A0A3B0VD39_9ZZZZ
MKINRQLMWSQFLIIGFLVTYANMANTQVCAIPGNDGNAVALSGVVNSYWSVAAGVYDATNTAITLQNQRGSVTAIVAGDLVLLIQMQCADIDFSDTDAYGDGIAGDLQLGSPVASGYSDPAGTCLAGEYEYVRAGPASSATNLDLTENSLINTYVQAVSTATSTRRVLQVIRVPQYDNVTLSGNIVPVEWDGFSGGVVALDMARGLDFAGNNIDVDGMGFRGGGGRERSVDDPVIRYRWDADDRHAIKGEGIAGTPRFVSEKRDPDTGIVAAITDLGVTWGGYPDGTGTDGDFARGAPATAGGGGTFWFGSSDNGGGGGGANGGAGGRGGAGWRSAGYAGINVDYSNLAEQKWGFGGSAFAAASISRVVLGGGGAGGDNNANSTPEESSGAAGAGIVMIRARSITGAGTISARGARAADNSLNDAAGGGGAGGSVVVITSDMSTATININVAGGRGADAWIGGGSAHGPGGGGGGGIVIRSGAATVTLTGGDNGQTTTADSPAGGASHGSTPGSIGLDSVITVPVDIPGINTGFRCLDFGDAPGSYGLADHNVGLSPGDLFLGTVIADGDPAILPNLSSASADRDDSAAIDDEDAASLPASSNSAGIYTVTVALTNISGSLANLCGWVDFDQDGVFQSDEAVCAIVASIAGNQNINLVFTIPLADRDNTGQLFARFRLSIDALTSTDATGSASDGEVEDHVVNVTTLPVSIHSFESYRNSDGLLIRWGTASETRNIGFHIWGNDSHSYKRLTKQMIPTTAVGALSPQEYQINLPVEYNNTQDLVISAVDVQGNEELFGFYQTGKLYGRDILPETIDWKGIQQQTDKILTQQKLYRSTGNRDKINNIKVSEQKVQLQTNSYGMHRLSYEDLLNAGFDLNNIESHLIAVSVKGKPVARWIGASSTIDDLIFINSFEVESNKYVNLKAGSTFGPGQFIDFWAKAPDFPDALYLDYYTYEISIDANLVKNAAIQQLEMTATAPFYQHVLTVNENNEYAFTNKSKDPWYAKRLIDFGQEQDKFYQLDFRIDDALAIGQDGMLVVKVIGGADLPDNPDHEVSISFNGVTLLTQSFDGITVQELTATVPAALLQTGDSQVELRLTSGTGVQFDIVLVDEVKLTYPRLFTAENNILSITENSLVGKMSVSGLDNTDIVAYGTSPDGNLFALATRLQDSLDYDVATLENTTADYWISNLNSIAQPTALNVIARDNLLTENADFLVIVHPAFMPLSVAENHPLNSYVQQRESEGWDVRVVSIADIQMQYGGGMPLPDALTSFLQAADTAFNYTHVLLVGSDSYDYKDYLGLQSISFIPTKYAETLFIPHTPSDALLTDLDGDGVGDKAIGRWPVRSISDLEAIVAKTMHWGNGSNLNIVLVTDEQDGTNQSFEAQAERLIDQTIMAGWDTQFVQRIYTDQLQGTTGLGAADQARELLFESWMNNKTLTNFIGHGSPTQWSRSGILAASDVTDLFNPTTPAMIGTLTCYTSYFVSPMTNTLAHQLMNGSDSLVNGAIAVHGAASLSDYTSNEVFAKHVLEQQLNGETLGQAIYLARLHASTLGYSDQVINWVLLGDPTLQAQVNEPLINGD